MRTQLSAALTAIVYQRLLPQVGGGLSRRLSRCWWPTPAVRNLIKDGKTHQLRNSLMTGQRDGMLTLEQSLSGLIRTVSPPMTTRSRAASIPRTLSSGPGRGSGLA